MAAKRALKMAYRLGFQKPLQKAAVCRTLKYGEPRGLESPRRGEVAASAWSLSPHPLVGKRAPLFSEGGLRWWGAPSGMGPG